MYLTNKVKHSDCISLNCMICRHLINGGWEGGGREMEIRLWIHDLGHIPGAETTAAQQPQRQEDRNFKILHKNFNGLVFVCFIGFFLHTLFFFLFGNLGIYKTMCTTFHHPHLKYNYTSEKGKYPQKKKTTFQETASFQTSTDGYTQSANIVDVIITPTILIATWQKWRNKSCFIRTFVACQMVRCEWPSFPL